MGYTWRQFNGYLVAARRRSAADELAQLNLMSAAFAGGDSAKALRSALLKATKS